MATDTKKFKILQVVAPRAEARKIEQYAKRKGVSVSGLLRKLVNLVIDANTKA